MVVRKAGAPIDLTIVTTPGQRNQMSGDKVMLPFWLYKPVFYFVIYLCKVYHVLYIKLLAMGPGPFLACIS